MYNKESTSNQLDKIQIFVNIIGKTHYLKNTQGNKCSSKVFYKCNSQVDKGCKGEKSKL